MAVKKEREYLTAITIVGGIIMLLDMNGNIAYYRQRGIQKLSDEQQRMLIAMGLLQRDWEHYQELPKHISISYEDPSIMGRARASYPDPEDILKAFKMSKETKKRNPTKK